MLLDKNDVKILKFMSNRDSAPITDEEFSNLISYVEEDKTMQMRELVFHIDRLIDLGYIKSEGKFYENDENISVKYLNGATQLYFEKLSVADDSQFKNNKSKFVLSKGFSYLTIYFLGMITMYIIMNLTGGK